MPAFSATQEEQEKEEQEKGGDKWGARMRSCVPTFEVATNDAGGSDPPVIRAPGLDRLLDVGAGEFFVHGALGQLREFGVGGETQAAQLIYCQFRNART